MIYDNFFFGDIYGVSIAVKTQWKINHEAGRGMDATTCQQEHCLQLGTAE